MGTPLLWFAFNLFVLIAIALDLGVFHRKAHKVGIREAALWSIVWVGPAVGLAILCGNGTARSAAWNIHRLCDRESAERG